MPTDRFVLGPADLVRVQFGVEPGQELMRAVRRLRHRPEVPLQTALLARIGAGMDPAALATLGHVVPPRGYTPDFLCQPGAQEPQAVRDGIRATPPEVVATELRRSVHEAGRAVPEAWLADPVVARGALADAWGAAWETGMRPEWPRLERVLRADVAERSRRLATDGLAAVVETLQPNLAWDGAAVVRRESRWGIHVDCAGRGLRLVPCLFAWPRGAITTDEPWPPTVYYPVRHATALPDDPAPEAAVRLMGRTRAQVLAHLVVPARTTDVALALEVSLATASHHLAVLRDAGLVTTARDGTQAWHSRTEAADRLGW